MTLPGRPHGSDAGDTPGQGTCASCGARIPATAASCVRCGHLFGVDAVTIAPTAGPQVSGPDSRAFADAMTRLPDAAAESPTMAPSMPAARGDTGPLDVGQAFSPRYHIIRLLGIGGMGAVYQAWDAELSVAVALKVIRPEALADARAAAEVERRFKRELLLARQVTHKNVVRIHDLGDIGGIKYITMSYVDGIDLATKIRREGRQSVGDVLHLARAVASGLVSAHTAGVIHRDLKPANIMLARDGDALIMDFGIALSTGDASAPADSHALPDHLRRSAAQYAVTTMRGVVGTVEYMAPEQATGHAVDQRADVYAFGLILYDALTGRRRHEHATSAIEELQRRMVEPPPQVTTIADGVPAPLGALITRCLDPDPAKRYQTSAELAADLERLDDRGELIPVRRQVTPRLVAAAGLLVAALLTGTFLVTRQAVQPGEAHEPVSVLIADVDNRTGDPAFDGTLEPMLRRALEGAGFISAFDRNGIRRTLGVQPPARLDAAAAGELAVKQGLGVVLASSIVPQGSGYLISVKATQTVTGNIVADARRRAPDKDAVLETANRLIAGVRNALGDAVSESDQIFAMTSLSATSLDVVRHYAAAQNASSNNQFAEARDHALQAVALDPEFGVGYQLLAVVSQNLRRLDDARKYSDQALRFLGGMTERERLSTRGFQFRVTGDYEQCAKEYGELIARYAADIVGHNQFALCQTQLRNMGAAVSSMRQVVALVPSRALFRTNLAWYESYAGNFDRGEQEARAITPQDIYSTHALAFAQLGQGQLDQAAATYQSLQTMGAQGASMAASGLGDLAIYQGRLRDAVRILAGGAAADVKAGDVDPAAAKFAGIAHAHLLRGDRRAAVAAAREALRYGSSVKIRFLAARTFVDAGDVAAARPLAEALAAQFQDEPQAYGKLIEAEIALAGADARAGVARAEESITLLDTWIGRYVLGRAYLAAGEFLRADSEFDTCFKRRGEVLALFADEEPTWGYLPMLYYAQGQAREALKSANATEPYRQYLAIRGAAGEDALLADIRRRLE